MDIDLGRGEIFMPQPVFELEDIDAPFRFVRAKGVPKGMRRRRFCNPCLLSIGLNEHLDGSLHEGLAILIQEELRGGRPRTNGKVGLESLHALFL